MDFLYDENSGTIMPINISAVVAGILLVVISILRSITKGVAASFSELSTSIEVNWLIIVAVCLGITIITACIFRHKYIYDYALNFVQLILVVLTVLVISKWMGGIESGRGFFGMIGNIIEVIIKFVCSAFFFLYFTVISLVTMYAGHYHKFKKNTSIKSLWSTGIISCVFQGCAIVGIYLSKWLYNLVASL